MSWLTDIIGVGKGIYTGDYDSAIGSGLDLVESVGPSIMKAYGTDQDQKSRNDAMNKVIAAMKDQEATDYQNQLAAWEAKNANNAANSAASAARQRQSDKEKKAALAKASKIQNAAYKKSMSMLEPYIAAGKAELPIRAQIYSQGMGSLGDLLKSSQESLASLPTGITAKTPKISWA